MGSTILERNARPIRYEEAATHLFEMGEIVRLKDGVPPPSQSANIYRITGTLPPRGDSPQYRIRNDDERYERVATQESLEPVRKSPGSRPALIERTFGEATQQPQDQRPKAGRGRADPKAKSWEGRLRNED